jgi:hypothetical protein
MSTLPSQQPHGPAGHEYAAEKENKAIESVLDHLASGIAMRDAKYDRREKCKYKRRAEMIESDGHYVPPRGDAIAKV